LPHPRPLPARGRQGGGEHLRHPTLSSLRVAYCDADTRLRAGRSKMDADAIVVGGGLAGLVAATELIEAGKRVILLDQEPPQSLGGQAFWSFGGLFFVDSPEQRRMRIRDSHDLAWQDWLGPAGFDRERAALPRKWAGA